MVLIIMTTGTILFFGGIALAVLCTALLIAQLLTKQKSRDRLLHEIQE